MPRPLDIFKLEKDGVVWKGTAENLEVAKESGENDGGNRSRRLPDFQSNDRQQDSHQTQGVCVALALFLTSTYVPRNSQ